MKSIALLLCLLPLSAFATDDAAPKQPTVAKSTDGGPAEVTLDEKEQKIFDKGDPVYKKIDLGGGGHGVAVFKVNAPPKSVWAVISDFDKYPQWIPSLKKTQTYKNEGDKIFVEFVLDPGFLLPKYTYYIEHNYPMEKKGWGTWKLDGGRKSDLESSDGFWRVTPIAGNPNQSMVTYSVEVKIKSAFFPLIRKHIEKRGLEEATQWVRAQAEKYDADHKAPTPSASK